MIYSMPRLDETNKRVIKRNSHEEHVVFMNIANQYAKFSKCQSKRVGCVIVKDRVIISTGCNGTPAGAVNCCDLFDYSKMSDPEYREKHHQFSNAMECHAEQNAIAKAARFGNPIDGTSFYVSMKPCEQCLKLIANLNVKDIYYSSEYDKFIEYSPEVKQMISELGIHITKIEIPDPVI